MGFFESFGLSHGKKPGEASGSSTYLPITMIDVRQLRIESYESDNGIVQQVIWRKAIELAEILCFGNKEKSHLKRKIYLLNFARRAYVKKRALYFL